MDAARTEPAKNPLCSSRFHPGVPEQTTIPDKVKVMAKLRLCVTITLGFIIQGSQGQLKHMAAHGHDLKHKKSEKAAPVAQAAPSDSQTNDDNQRAVEFDEAFVELQKYFKENKHSKVPQAVAVTLPDGTLFKLGKWLGLFHPL